METPIHPSPEASPRFAAPKSFKPRPRDLPPEWVEPIEQREAPQVRLKTFIEFTSEYAPLSYVVEPIVRNGSLYSLTAKTGAGKTAWMISVALAIATGRKDILNLEVRQGRVAFCTFENPDDVRMRMMVACFLFGIDGRDISNELMVLDLRVKPEQAEAQLRIESKKKPFALFFVDTLAAFFDGDDFNNPVQAGEFIRRIRPWTQLPGGPAGIIAAHPVKNAGEDNLVPYGSGAILNEVDGNLTLWKSAEAGIVKFHWQGKLRGLDFNPIDYRFEVAGSPDVLDDKGREVHLPAIRSAANVDAEAREAADIDVSKKLMRAIRANPKATQRELAAVVDRSASVVNVKLRKLKADKLIEQDLGIYSLTSRGEKALERAA